MLIKLLFLLFVANGAPILVRQLLGLRFNHPVDNGYLLADGQPLFGYSKTWRGILAALLLTTPAATLLGLPAISGFLIASGAMAGDLLSSFIKRRMHIAPSQKALGLDQIPESLLPLLLVTPQFQLDVAGIFWLVVLFTGLGLVLSKLLFWMNIRKHPY